MTAVGGPDRSLGAWAPILRWLASLLPGAVGRRHSLSPRYWDCVVDFHRCRHLPSVLLLVFEDLTANLPAHLPRLAAFLGVRADAALYEHVAHVASKQWMAAHEALFDDHWLSRRQAACATAPRTVPPSPKVVAGAHASRLSEASRAMLRERWASQVAPLTGCATYEEMAAELLRERRLSAGA